MIPIGIYNFSNRSFSQVKTCHEDLQKIITGVLYYSDIDFMVIEGNRTVERQYQLFLQGLSKVDGKTRKGKHNYDPSLALDFAIYVKGEKELMYDFNHLCFLAGVITTVAKVLYEAGEITHLIRWGGNWDKDGEIISDQTFQDLCHIELYKP